MQAQIGKKAPNLDIAHWVQGGPTNIDLLKGKVVLVEVFQVNCPGCFLSGLPQAIDLHNRYDAKGLTVLGLSTAFEDFDKNSLSNLRLLLDKGVVIGETLDKLMFYEAIAKARGFRHETPLLVDGSRLPYRIPFPVAMDVIGKEVTERKEGEHNIRITHHTDGKTFTRYGLRGTPSSILIDRKGMLRGRSFGRDDDLDEDVEKLLAE
ncbi:MAG: TlpA family protein disulfide reductase [Candidatus Micrarchaeota archaeon]|nr:TlpA family protein disulfide reductase [Candidatus Micrarchaeota archaeon]